MISRQKITPFLWFDGTAEAAMHFYVSIFANSKIVSLTRAGGGQGAVVMGTFQLDGLEFYALNGGPHFKFTEALSLFVHCEDQEEVDTLWVNLSAGGSPGQCGWLKDQFGVSWQIIPRALSRLLQDPDPVKAGRVRDAMLRMTKIDVAALERAYHGR